MNADEVSRLVDRARTGDGSAWNAIVDEYAGVVWCTVRRFRLAEAEAADAVQTTWLRLVEHVDSIKNPACIAGWLATTARRTCLERIRESAREFAVDPHEDTRFHATAEPRWDDAPESMLLRREDVTLVRTALATLDERDRTLLMLLTSPEGHSYRDIGARLSIPTGSIGPTRARALARLRTALAAVGVIDMAR